MIVLPIEVEIICLVSIFAGIMLYLMRWRPKKEIVYKSWTKEYNAKRGFNYWHDFQVQIIINGEEQSGSFSIGDNWCEIRTSKYKMILPKKNVSFSKSEVHPRLVQGYGEGLITTYIAKVKHFSQEDLDRFTNWKKTKE